MIKRLSLAHASGCDVELIDMLFVFLYQWRYCEPLSVMRLSTVSVIRSL